MVRGLRQVLGLPRGVPCNVGLKRAPSLGALSFGSRVCLAQGSEGRGGKGRSQKL